MNTCSQNRATSASEAEKITPRAEFRVFGKSIIAGIQEKMWDARANLHAARKMPVETYFLSVHTDAANVKVRDNLLDIKTKTGETEDGYEIFQPRGKFRFPVKKEDLRTILSHLQVEMTTGQDEYTLDAFVALAQKHPDLRIVSVEKMRYGFSIDGIICEYAQVWFNGALVETACCESENYAGIKAVAEKLGIAGLANTNYLKAAKQVVGM